MQRVRMDGLIRIDLLTRPLLLCGAGFVRWGADTYLGRDPEYGAIADLGDINEGIGNDVPGLTLTLFPADDAAAGLLASPLHQNRRVRMWIAEIDEETGLIIGDPDLQFEGLVDRPILRIADSGEGAVRTLELEIVSAAERLFLINEGNSLSSRFHKIRYSAETGEDNGTGLGISVPWGVEAPPRSVGSSAASGRSAMIQSVFGR